MRDIRVNIELRLSVGEELGNTGDVVKKAQSLVSQIRGVSYTIEDIYQHFDDMNCKPLHLYSNKNLHDDCVNE
jgi:hypothetical protein